MLIRGMNWIMVQLQSVYNPLLYVSAQCQKALVKDVKESVPG